MHPFVVRVQVLGVVMDRVILRTMELMQDLEVGVVVEAYQTMEAPRLVLDLVRAQALRLGPKEFLLVQVDILVLVVQEVAVAVDKLPVLVDPQVMGLVVELELVRAIRTCTLGHHIGEDQAM